MKITYEGKDYELGFNRNTAAAAERAGLVIDKLSTSPHIHIPLLVFYAFKMNYPQMTMEQTNKIHKELKGKTKRVIALRDEFIATYKDLLSDDEDEDEDEDGENFDQRSNE